MSEGPDHPDLDDRDLTGLVVREAVLDRARFIGVVMRGAEIDGLLGDLVVNGVEVTAYVEAELDRRHPERLLIRSHEPDELREAWTVLQRQWASTIDRLRRLGEDAAQTQVGGEWSAVQTLRHLVFVTESWLLSAALGQDDGFSPLGLGASFMDGRALGLDHDARPSLAEVLALRAVRVGDVRRVLDEATPERLATEVPSSGGGGWPPPAEGRTLLDCLHVVLDEEWAHHSFCVRDLDAIEASTSS